VAGEPGHLALRRAAGKACLPHGVAVPSAERSSAMRPRGSDRRLPVAPGAGPNADTDTDCTGIPAVIYINPNTGRQRIVTTLPYGSDGFGYQCDGENLAENQGAIVDGDYTFSTARPEPAAPTQSCSVFRWPLSSADFEFRAAVRPQTPGPLAIGPNATFTSPTRGEIRCSNSSRAVASECCWRRPTWVLRDGGPASAAELRLGGAGLAFSRDGTL